MKKVLFACDGMQFSEGAFAFARYLNSQQPLLLTGVFIPQTRMASLWSYSNAVAGTALVPVADENENEALPETTRLFEQRCRENGIAYRVHTDFFDFALPELKRETRFADLLLISSERFYGSISGQHTSDYVLDALHASECGVVVVPEQFSFPEKIILAYDGSESSVFAIKQFAYLFPSLCRLPAELVYAASQADAAVPNEEYIRELAGQHFENLHLLKMEPDTGKDTRSWVNETNALLVSGAYGRSFLSQIFRKSFVSGVIHAHKLPVFIAHR